MGTRFLPGPNGATFLAEGPGPWYDTDSPRQRSPGPSLGVFEIPQLSLRSELDLREGERELDLLRRSFGRMLNSTGKLVYTKTTGAKAARKKSYATRQYLTDRDWFFGSRDAYKAYLSVGRSELDADGGWLRTKVDPPLASRHEPDWRDAQEVFYTWVRRAFDLENGAGVSLVAAVRFGMSERLQAALAQVRIDSGEKFAAGGYNPRPKKKEGYRLGTISEHATGNAIDINDNTNAQIKKWKEIESYTGSSQSSERQRKALWQSDPQRLHASISDINARFVSRLRAAVKAQEDGGLRGKAALEAVVAADADLSALTLPWVEKWREGFFDLSWALVKELHEEKLTWGATFETPDLHHFEFQKAQPVVSGKKKAP